MERPVVMLATGEPSSDPRVWRASRAVAAAGAQVVVVAGVEDASGAQPDRFDGVAVRRVRVGQASSWLRRRVGPRSERAPASAEPVAARRDAERPKPALAGLVSALFVIARSVKRGLSLAAVARRLRPGVVHAHDDESWLAGALVARLAGCPLVLDAHELPGELRPQWGRLTAALYRGWCRPWIRRSSAILAVNDAIAEHIEAAFGVSRPVPIWNCPPIERELPARPPGDGRLRVLFHGILDHERGLEALIEGAARVPGVTLRLRGRGPLEPALRAIARRARLDPDEVFLPPVPMPDLVRLAAAFDVGAIPTPPLTLNTHLMAPNKLFEYLMAGLCVISTDAPVVRRLLEEVDAGILVEPTPEGWEGGLAKLAGDRDYVRAAGARARAAAERRWSWERQGATMLRVYESVLDARTP